MATNGKFSFVQLDVFTSRALEGNPLAVFPNAEGLDDQAMQAIAREMNLSETTFIFPRDSNIEKQRGVRVRIFTVQEELPFAGHPTLGTAFRTAGKLRSQ
jgi:trans-2,3-dihydro-3-hydroxyanthranilate isomerase